MASEDETYKGESLLIINTHKRGYTHPTPALHLAKPEDAAFHTAPGSSRLSTAVFTKHCYLMPEEGWGEHRLIQLHPGKDSICINSFPLPNN